MKKKEKQIDLTHLDPKYQGKWVVMSRKTKRVFVSAEAPTSDLIKKAEDLGCKDPIFHKVLPFDTAFVS